MSAAAPASAHGSTGPPVALYSASSRTRGWPSSPSGPGLRSRSASSKIGTPAAGLSTRSSPGRPGTGSTQCWVPARRHRYCGHTGCWRCTGMSSTHLAKSPTPSTMSCSAWRPTRRCRIDRPMAANRGTWASNFNREISRGLWKVSELPAASANPSSGGLNGSGTTRATNGWTICPPLARLPSSRRTSSQLCWKPWEPPSTRSEVASPWSTSPWQPPRLGPATLKPASEPSRCVDGWTCSWNLAALKQCASYLAREVLLVDLGVHPDRAVNDLGNAEIGGSRQVGVRYRAIHATVVLKVVQRVDHRPAHGDVEVGDLSVQRAIGV